MKTEFEMYNYIKDNNYYFGKPKKIDDVQVHLEEIESILKQNEDVKVVCGTYIEGMSIGVHIVAITNYRIIYTCNNILGNSINSINLEKFTDIKKVNAKMASNIYIDCVGNQIHFYMNLEKADELFYKMQTVIYDVVNLNKHKTSLSSADEIKKYKELLDCGAITQEEFDKKKKELLNL